MQIVQNKLKNTFSLDFLMALDWPMRYINSVQNSTVYSTKQYGLQYKTVRFTVQNSRVYST